MRRTVPAPGRVPVNKSEIEFVARQVGLQKFSHSLVRDFVNVAEGGRVLPPSAYSEEIREQARKKAQNGKVDDRPNLESSWYELMMRYHRRVSEFVRMTPIDRFPGNTALEKTMALLKLLSKQSGGESGPSTGSEEPQLPIFQDGKSSKSPEEVQQALEDILDLSESLTEAEKDMVDPNADGHEPNDLSREDQDGSREGASPLSALKIAEKMTAGSDERKILEIARTLQQFVQLEIKKQNKIVADPNSDQFRQRPIRHLGELGKLSSSELAKIAYLPKGYFNYLALSGGLQVRERITHEEKMQCIFILMDISGSTTDGDIRAKMTGVVMNRLLGVVQGEAEVYLGLFDTELKVLGSAKTPAEAREMIKKFKAGNYSGGGTNIANGVKAAHAFIEKKIAEGEALWRPEVVVLTDEDSSSDGVTAAEIPGTKVHGFAMSHLNPNLVQLCRSTGGFAFEKF